MSERIDIERRRLLGVAAATVAAVEWRSAMAPMPQQSVVKQVGVTPAVPAGTAFARPKQVAAGVLGIGYVEVGPGDGHPVILLHGWPYDVHSFADVAPVLAVRGYRVLVPYLRGYGPTRFLSAEAPRNGQQAALASDCIAFMDALGIQKAIVAGFDWGARTANIVAALWPDRCTGMVSVSGYLIGSRELNQTPLLPSAEVEW